MVRILDANTPAQFAVSFRDNSGVLVDVTTPAVAIFDYTNQQVMSTTSGFSDVTTGKKNFLLDPVVLTTQGTYRAVFYGSYNSQRIYSDYSPALFEISTLGNLITYASVKDIIDYLELAEPISITLLRDITQAVTQLINYRCRRQFRQYTVIEEEHWLEEDAEVFLQQYPVIGISSIAIEGVAIDAASYDLDKHIGRIKFTTTQTGILKVTYTAGVASVPDPIHMAAIKLCAYMYQRRKREGVSSESLLGYSYTLWTDGEDPSIKEVLALLQPYTHVRVL